METEKSLLEMMGLLIDQNQILTLQTEMSLATIQGGDMSQYEPNLCQIRDGLSQNASLLRRMRKTVGEMQI
jgi:hypothetical protein